MRWRLEAERSKIEAQLMHLENHPWYSRLVRMVTDRSRHMSSAEQLLLTAVGIPPPMCAGLGGCWSERGSSVGIVGARLWAVGVVCPDL